MGFHGSLNARVRFTAVLLCLLSLLGHLGVVAHQLFEAHVVCAEHGELFHADQQGNTRQPPPERAAWRTDSGEDAHDHCWAPAHRDDDYVAISSTLPVLDQRTPSHTVGSRPADATWLASIGLLSLAPKQSPPPANG